MSYKKDVKELARERSNIANARIGASDDFRDRMRARAESMQPRLVTSNQDSIRQEMAREVLPEGHTLAVGSKKADVFAPFTGGSSMSGGYGSSNFHTQRPYLPEFDSPERQFYPHDRAVANKYWRMFYKYDPVFGTAVDMYSQMMVSEFDIILENQSDQTLKNELEDMADDVFLLEKLQSMVKEYLVTGEVLPHNFFDDKTNKWSYIGFHDPDYIDIQDSPIIDMDPIIYFIPDDNLRNMLLDTTPESQELRQKLPSEFVSKVLARQKIRLSPLNCSYIPRKLHPYDERGVSLASRMWRIWMVEDAVYNSTIQTFRRAASPLRVAKIGDQASGWIPGPEAEANLQRLLMQSEIDPGSWLIYNYGIQFETVGINERAVTLSREHSTIEQVKLLALGLSKSFMTGETTFSSAKSGLQVFLRRLLSMRQFFENTWILPKFFQPIIQINDWTKSKPSEVAHRYRVKRTAQEKQDSNLYIKPRLKWRNKLDPAVDSELLTAYSQLRNFGFDISLDSVGSIAGLDWKEETTKSAKEFAEREHILNKELGGLKGKFEQKNMQKGKPPGTAGGGARPPGSSGLPSSGGGLGGDTEPGMAGPPGSADGTGPSDMSLDSPGPGGADVR